MAAAPTRSVIGIRRILVPVDLSPSGRVAIDYGEWLAEHLGATVDVLNVIRPPSDPVEPPPGAPPSQTRVERLSANICDSILRRVEADHYDLVVLAVRRPIRIADLIWWHVSEMVVHHAPCPVLTLHAGTDRDVDTAQARGAGAVP